MYLFLKAPLTLFHVEAWLLCEPDFVNLQGLKGGACLQACLDVYLLVVVFPFSLFFGSQMIYFHKLGILR